MCTRRSVSAFVVTFCLALVVGGGAAVTAAEPSGAAGIDWAQQADRVLAGSMERLSLSEEQAGRIRPLLAAYLPKLRALFDSYAGESFESAPSLVRQFKEAREAFRVNIEPILTPEQMATFMELRKDVDHEIRKAFVEARLAWFRGTLGIDEAQAERARPIVAENFDKRLEIVAWHSDATGNPAVRRPLWPELRKVQEETDAKLRGIFTPEQMDAYLAARAARKKAAAAPASGD